MSFPKGIPIGTVRESTRGMESNKQYIVVEPIADFEHIEYVIVLRYKPQAEAVQGRESATDIEFVPIADTAPCAGAAHWRQQFLLQRNSDGNARGGSRGNGDGDTQSHAYACAYSHAGAGDNTRRYLALV